MHTSPIMTLSKTFSKALGLLGCHIAALLATGQDPMPVQRAMTDVRTIQLAPVGSPLAPPFVPLEGGQLRLSFDWLGEQAPHFFLRFQHCTFDWYPSPDLEVGDFLEGFQEPAMATRAASFGTKVSYTHYQTDFPNDLTRFTKSGNYTVEVIDPAAPDQPVLTTRFVLFESLASFSAELREPPQLDQIRSHQALDFTLQANEYPLADAHDALQVVVLQNGFWTLGLSGLVPRFVRGSEVDFRTADLANFPGGNAWRFADLKSLRFVSQGVARIEEGDRFWHFDLTPDNRRAYKTFDARPDINGAFVVHNDQFEGATESDYIMAHFHHEVDAPYPGNLFVLGGFSGGLCQTTNQMQWNAQQKRYDANILLKQGYYNYMYAFQPHLRSRNAEDQVLNDWFGAVEGNHHMAGNRYDFFAYYWDLDGYDRVIGHEVLEVAGR